MFDRVIGVCLLKKKSLFLVFVQHGMIKKITLGVEILILMIIKDGE
jgi:hypothetical protein